MSSMSTLEARIPKALTLIWTVNMMDAAILGMGWGFGSIAPISRFLSVT